MGHYKNIPTWYTNKLIWNKFFISIYETKREYDYSWINTFGPNGAFVSNRKIYIFGLPIFYYRIKEK